jgi:RNA polymerase sigma-70 factor (ECF subfamily)
MNALAYHFPVPPFALLPNTATVATADSIKQSSPSSFSILNRMEQTIPPTSQRKYTTWSDEELFAHIRERSDEAAFNVLYKRYDKRLYSYCLRAAGSHEAAQDAFQAVMSAVFEKRESFTGGSYAAWLFTIARHHVLKLGRNKHRTAPLDDTPTALERPASEETRADRDFLLQQSLHAAIARLPDDLRESFELKYCQGFQHEEIATTLGITVSLAKVRVFRAKQQLRALLAPLFEELQSS